ncbi:MAG: hypothetical protein EBS74_01850 [Flavobacteriia bacterium]|nr:hypothetical protein [Flavobacteriia bacterium]
MAKKSACCGLWFQPKRCCNILGKI